MGQISSRGRKNSTSARTVLNGLGEETLVSELDYTMLHDFCVTRLEVDGVKPSTINQDVV
ncbi:hypothetical protein KZO85_03570 [Chromohalobacter canadensis]|uniref:hypothetical protein n=1 Tax=Chromohalobacter canadensis TaxID=141389 RepID=UPI0021C0B032|nr:hypothetical protein [Chromohalobacter canadensis]MCT8467653.1 hypothetical protein [Chromohalobacter canadensis]MCT8470599.1 hypothetical protein [Chromohalobacter canadensis]MCT8498150.1 hypothetical protein [Chromohalobacter canadensis]